MKDHLKNRLKRTVILSLVAVVIGGGIGFFQAKDPKSRVVEKPSRLEPMAGIQVGGPFELIDENGQTVSDKDFSDVYKLIYFGFASCPAICPTELQKIAGTMKALPEEQADKVQPLFITIDPARDTVEVMHDYVALFYPRLKGLTGSQEQIDRVLKSYRVYASKVQDEGMSDYTMDHSSFIYLMSPDDRLLSMYRIQDTAEKMAQDVQARLTAQP